MSNTTITSYHCHRSGTEAPQTIAVDENGNIRRSRHAVAPEGWFPSDEDLARFGTEIPEEWLADKSWIDYEV